MYQMSDDEFLNSIAGTPSTPKQQPQSSGPMSDDDFLNSITSSPSESFSFEQPRTVDDPNASIWDTVKRGFEAQGQAFLAANVSEKNSAYANRRAKRKYDEWKEEQEKLGIGGQLVAGVTEYAPTVLAALATRNPYVGAGVMGLQSTGESLREQAGAGMTPDMARAQLAGTAAAGVDLATAGLAGKMIGKLPTQTAVEAALSGGKASLARRAAPLAIEATQGGVSNSAAQIFSNMSAGKDWTEGAAEAGLFGVAGAGAIRGAGEALSKLNSRFKIPMSEQAKTTFKNADEMYIKRGYKPSENHLQEAAAATNLRADMQTKMDPSKYDMTDPIQRQEYEDNIRGAVNLSRTNAGAAADIDALSMFVKNNIDMLDTGYYAKVSKDLDHSDSYAMHEAMGVSIKDIAQIGKAREEAHVIKKDADKALAETSYAEADAEKFQRDFQKMYNNAAGTLTSNISAVKARRQQYEMEGVDREFLKPYIRLEQALTTIKNKTDDYVNPRSPSDADSLAMATEDVYRYAGETGMLSELKSVNGEKGNYDAIRDAMTLERLDKMAGARMYNVKQGTPNIHKPSGPAADASFMSQIADAVPGGAAAKKTASPLTAPFRERGARKSREQYIRAREFSKQRTADIVELARMTREEGGTPPPVNKMEVAERQVDSSIDDLKNADLFNEQPAPIPEPLVEAPVTPVEPVVPRSAPVAPVRPEMPQGAVQEPVAAPRDMLPPDPRQMAASEAPAQPNLPMDEIENMIAKQWEADEKARFDAEEAAAKAAKTKPVAPSKPKAKEPVVEPVVEAPPAPRERIPARKPDQPTAKAEEPVQSVPEPVVAPESKVEVEPIAEAPKKPVGMFAKNLSKMKEKVNTLSRKPRSEAQRELLSAKHDAAEYNRTINKISEDLKMTRDEIAEVMDQVGGLEGLRKIAKEQDRVGEEAKILKNQVKVMDEKADMAAKETAKKIQQAANTVAEAQTKVDAEKAHARAVAEKHIGVRDRMEAMGYDSDIIDEALKRGKASDTTKDFDPALVRTWARNLQGKKDAKIKAEANAKAAEAQKALDNLKPTLKSQKARVDKYVNGLMVADDPTIAGHVKKAFSHTKGKPIGEGQVTSLLRRIDDYIDQQKRAYEAVMKNPDTRFTPTEQAENAIKFRKWKEAKDKVAGVREEMAKAKDKYESELSKTAAEAEKTRAEQERIDTAKKKRDDAAQENLDKVDNQEAEMREDLKKYGADDEFIEQNMAKSFYRRTTPLSESQLSNLYKALTNKVDANKAALEKAVKKDLKPVLEALPSAQLKSATSEIMTNFEQYGTPTHNATVDTVVQSLKDRGLERDAKVMEQFHKVVDKAMDLRKKYPDNQEYWISAEDKASIQDAFSSDTGKSYMGNLGMKLKAEFYGDTNVDKMNLSRKTINDRIEGKGIGEGLRVSFKQIGKRVNKPQTSKPVEPTSVKETIAPAKEPGKFAAPASAVKTLSGKSFGEGRSLKELNADVEGFKQKAMDAIAAKAKGAWPMDLETYIQKMGTKRSKADFDKMIKGLNDLLDDMQ